MKPLQILTRSTCSVSHTGTKVGSGCSSTVLLHQNSSEKITDVDLIEWAVTYFGRSCTSCAFQIHGLTDKVMMDFDSFFTCDCEL